MHVQALSARQGRPLTKPGRRTRQAILAFGFNQNSNSGKGDWRKEGATRSDNGSNGATTESERGSASGGGLGFGLVSCS